jgi:large-conductance mechanosensitive channel
MFGGKQPDFSKKVLNVNGSDIPFGAFATSALNFFFVALALFMVVKLYNKFRSTDDKAKAALNTNDLLVEIRDELRASRNSEKG